MKKLSIFCAFCFVLSAFAYTSEDVSNATYLSEQGIVTKQTTATGYRLDDTILRQEVIGMALKIKGITLPENYKCKKYFADVTKNDWVCRAVELAADNGIITRSNTYANPGKLVTRAEALVMTMKAGGIETVKYLDPSFEQGRGFTNVDITTDWIYKVFENALYTKIIDLNTLPKKQDPLMNEVGGGWKFYFYPNRLATRAEVFGFARNILFPRNNETISSYLFELIDNPNVKIIPDEPKILYLKTGDKKIEVDRGYISNIKIIKNHLIYDWTLTGGTITRIYSIESSKIWWFMGNSQIDKNNNYIFGCEGEIYSLCQIASLEKGYSVYIIYKKNNPELDQYVFLKHISGSRFELTLGSKKETIDVIQETTTIKSILDTYYALINSELGEYGMNWFDRSYEMRSPAGVSFETFQSWYKNTTNVIFREDTLKNLGDNTYEFLVDMTEKGVTSTYKVKSKVNLEKFTIDNISSVKQ